MRNCSWHVAAVLVLSIGCAHYPINLPLVQHAPTLGYRFANLTNAGNSDSLFVILAFSGGGTRAAAFSYGVLEELARTEIVWEGTRRRLLDEVDVISSVSGGSFTAAYYALYGERIFRDFQSRFLERDVEKALMMRLVSPITWWRLMSPTFDRVDLAAEYYDAHVFDQRTFSALLASGRRPFVVINATDMSIGTRFEFTQAQFDLICSDLRAFPIARAVAASSAFPLLLSPVTVRNYAGTCTYREPEWVEAALGDRDLTARRFQRALVVRSYRDQETRPFLHLLDGGIADNIGLRGPLDQVVSTDGEWSVLRMINREVVRKLVVISANAKTEPNVGWDRRERAPSWLDVIGTAATVPMGHYSFETEELLRETVQQWIRDEQAVRDCIGMLHDACPSATPPSTLHHVDFYPIEIGFDAVADEGERRWLKNLPTTFALPSDTVDRLRSVAAALLADAEKFRELRNDLR